MNPPTHKAHLSGKSEEVGSPLLPPPAQQPFRTTFASMSIHRTDRIRFLQFLDTDITAIRAIIKRTHDKGIQDERVVNMSHEFKLVGNPWTGLGNDALVSRIVMREILAYLYSEGWILTASTIISKNEYDQDTMFFRKQSVPPPPGVWMAISFLRSDRLRLMGAPVDLIVEFRGLLQSMALLQDEGGKDQGYEFKCVGNPWRAMAEETMGARRLFLRMLALLEEFGWSLYASVNQNNGMGDRREAESWYCVRERDWVRGSTVFHR